MCTEGWRASSTASFEQYPDWFVVDLWFFDRARPFPRMRTITRSVQLKRLYARLLLTWAVSNQVYMVYMIYGVMLPRSSTVNVTLQLGILARVCMNKATYSNCLNRCAWLGRPDRMVPPFPMLWKKNGYMTQCRQWPPHFSLAELATRPTNSVLDCSEHAY